MVLASTLHLRSTRCAHCSVINSHAVLVHLSVQLVQASLHMCKRVHYANMLVFSITQMMAIHSEQCGKVCSKCLLDSHDQLF